MVGEDEAGADNLLTGHSELTESAVKRARLMSSLGRITRTHAVYFVEKASREQIGDTAIVEREEAENVEESDELRDLIRQRAEG